LFIDGYFTIVKQLLKFIFERYDSSCNTIFFLPLPNDAQTSILNIQDTTMVTLNK